MCTAGLVRDFVHLVVLKGMLLPFGVSAGVIRLEEDLSLCQWCEHSSGVQNPPPSLSFPEGT